MNIQETIFKCHNDIIANTPLASDTDYQLKYEDVAVIASLSHTDYYLEILQKDIESAFINLLIISMRKYGEAKWNEAVEATRNSICNDQSTPPKFIE